MAFVYEINNKVNGKKYVGITRNSVRSRWNSHKCSAKSRVTYLYNAMNKYGVESFSVKALVECSWEYACQLEKALVATGNYTYNTSAGGEGGFVVPLDKVNEWKEKLSVARKGRRPALGMKHTAETKATCKEASVKYWENQKTYDAIKVTSLPFAEASATFGVSKTHYYRLKRSLISDQ